MNIIITEYSSGFADSSYLLCNYLSRHDDSNNIIYLSDVNNFYFDNVDTRIITNKLYLCFKSGDKYKKGSIRWVANRVITTLINAFKRNKYIKQKKPDIVIIIETLSIIDQFFIKTLKNTTIVLLTVHDVIVPKKSLSWGKHSLKRSYEIADGLIVHSEDNKQQLIKMFGISNEKIQIIHHGVEIEYNKLDKERCIKQLNITNELPILLFYGGIRESKGLDILLEALSNIECQLIIAGNMPYDESFDKYNEMIKYYNIMCLKFIKFTSDEFRDILFQASDYIILPYKYFYSQSGVFMQAIHYRKPVIASDVGSFRNYIDEYNMGYVCKSNDVNSLHETIKLAISELKSGKWINNKSIQEAAMANSWQESARKYTEYCKQFHGKLNLTCNKNKNK